MRLRGGKEYEKIGSSCTWHSNCLLYTSDAADELDGVDLGGRRINMMTY